MPKVIALEEHLVNQIAAGEVVERPASVVKELLENALDAHSNKIVLEIVSSGKEKISVSDDGCGMEEADAVLSLARHTTSKIQRFEDLSCLHSFGFRGEALPSIASVCKLDFVTSTGDKPAVRLVVEGGKIIEKMPASRARGTTIVVNDLFYNVPARQKFLKSDVTERARISRTLEEIALAHPHVGFTYKSDGRVIADLPSRIDGVHRLEDLWGKDFAPDRLIRLDTQHPFITISGWVSRPNTPQLSKNYQIFYVNRRPIVSRSLSHALYEAYRDSLPVGRHPVAVIFIDVDPASVDVNVHPSKREVRFVNESQIYESLIQAIRSQRSQQMQSSSLLNDPSPFVSDKSQTQELTAPLPKMEPFDSPQNVSQITPTKPLGGRAEYFLPPVFKPEVVAPAPVLPLDTSAAASQQVLSQFDAVYVLIKKENNLVILDQHAASERILYEKFQQAASNKNVIARQKLLLPFLWATTLAQAEVLKHYLETFQKIGFTIEVFGEKTFRIIEIPADLKADDLALTLQNILEDLSAQKDPQLAQEALLKQSACRAAVKAGDKLSNAELTRLLHDLSLCQNPHTCPHGRPTTLTIHRHELDKKFGRLYN